MEDVRKRMIATKTNMLELGPALPHPENQRYRQKQLADWIYDKGVRDFDAMRNLPKEWREELAQHYTLSPFASYERFASWDGSVRYLFRLEDGKQTEAVYMPYENRKTICISSMVGCPAGCAFCATGAYGFGRNLSKAEIIGQILAVAQGEELPPKAIRNVVLMGMGEALLNYNNALTAIRWMIEPTLLDMSPRRITLSTVGLPKKIIQLADEGMELVLALSLHAPDDETRQKIIPTAHAHSIDAIIDALHLWQDKTGRRVTIEYTMLRGVNDHLWQAKMLLERLQGLISHVNLIPFNDWQNDEMDSGFARSSRQRIEEFRQVLEAAGMSVSVRFSRGQDAGAACGQLALKKLGKTFTPAS